MTRPTKLEDEAVTMWLASHAGWVKAGDTLVRALKFPDYERTIAFVVRLALVAEKRDHHPDLVVKWGAVEVTWSTHDAGGITALDLELAERTDALFGG